jgi:hypothetical protein
MADEEDKRPTRELPGRRAHVPGILARLQALSGIVSSHHVQNVNEPYHRDLTFGDRVAFRVVGAIGGWRTGVLRRPH